MQAPATAVCISSYRTVYQLILDVSSLVHVRLACTSYTIWCLQNLPGKTSSITGTAAAQISLVGKKGPGTSTCRGPVVSRWAICNWLWPRQEEKKRIMEILLLRPKLWLMSYVSSLLIAIISAYSLFHWHGNWNLDHLFSSMQQSMLPNILLKNKLLNVKKLMSLVHLMEMIILLTHNNARCLGQALR